MIIVDVQQASDQWFQEKIGKPSASNASKIITNEGKPSKQADGYMYELAAEILTGVREETFQSPFMATGVEREDESRKLYELMHGVEVSQVGLVYKDDRKQFLCSPDGIINNEYGLELKNVQPKTQVKYLLDGDIPSEYFGQVQFSLYVTGFKFWDFMAYSPLLKPLVVRCYPDKKYQEALDRELGIFCNELKSIVTKLKGE